MQELFLRKIATRSETPTKSRVYGRKKVYSRAELHNSTAERAQKHTFQERGQWEGM
jgi:hypothetical protein